MTDTFNSTGEINSSLKNGIALSKYAAGALLGSLIGVCVGLALGLQGWLGVVTLVGVILVCAVYGKNRLLLLLALFFMTYFAGMGYSRNKIASFCNSISATTYSAELLSLAGRARVDLDQVQ